MEMETHYLENRALRIGIIVLLSCVIWQLDYSELTTNRTLCLFHALTGKYCYGCGLLKGAAACMHFDFIKAWELNPLNMITIPLITYIVFKEIILKDGILPILKKFK